MPPVPCSAHEAVRTYMPLQEHPSSTINHLPPAYMVFSRFADLSEELLLHLLYVTPVLEILSLRKVSH